MTKFFCSFSAFLVGLALLGGGDARVRAQDAIAPDSASSFDEDSSRYRTVAPRPEVNSIARQKAIFRAEQRLARRASLKWYGFSAARPTASGIPWTTMYSPAWTMPGGRPYGWYMSSRPVVIISAPAGTTYR